MRALPQRKTSQAAGPGPDLDRAGGPRPAGMDRPAPRGIGWGLGLVGGVAALVVLGCAAWFASAPDADSVAVPLERLRIGRVAVGSFAEFVPVGASLMPSESVFLDTAEGGRVVAVHVEEGAVVAAGQPLVTLKNVDLELQVMAMESQHTEQLSSLLRGELEFDAQGLAYERDLMDVQLQLNLGRAELERSEKLLISGVALSVVERLRMEQVHYARERKLIEDARDSDREKSSARLAQLRASVQRMEASLELMRGLLGGLTVEAPIAGRLTGMDVRVGAVVPAGSRIGQVDVVGEYVLRANVDEHYLGAVRVGQGATGTLGEQEFRLEIVSVSPQVEGRSFEVELGFAGPSPADLRRGQSLRVRIDLGGAAEVLTIPNGAFFEQTGGAWVFVVNHSDTQAVRRDVTLGRRNPDLIEVLTGLEPGERIVTSSYQGLTRAGLLNLKGS